MKEQQEYALDTTDSLAMALKEPSAGQGRQSSLASPYEKAFLRMLFKQFQYLLIFALFVYLLNMLIKRVLDGSNPIMKNKIEVKRAEDID